MGKQSPAREQQQQGQQPGQQQGQQQRQQAQHQPGQQGQRSNRFGSSNGATTIHYEDPISGLRSATSLGRPNWNSVFEEAREAHPESSVGVFVCGPRAISRILRGNCDKYNAMPGGTKFAFHKENF
jgi:hypothetical protein